MKHKIKFNLLIVVLALFFFNCNQMKENKESTEAANTNGEPAVQSAQQKPFDKTILVGEWTRTDAPYQIKISELMADGNMKAEYFNPRSIHVSKAMWATADGSTKIYIELRDENYPGSNYTLIYYPEKDMLAGKYFQAVEGINYDVGFLRKN